MKVKFITLGCKVNKYETDILKEKAIDKGYEIAKDNEIADIYVINSCSVTNMSDRKTRQMLSKARKENIKSKVIVVGCSVENYKNNLGAFKGAYLLLGNEEKLDLFNILNENANKDIKLKLTDIGKVKRYKSSNILVNGTDIRQQIKIEDGCNNFCTYCVIPYIRGRVRSRNINEIEKEANNLAKNNVKEIVLTGIEIAAYGMDLEGVNLFDVLNIIQNIDGIQRIRLSSIHPNFLTTENIKRLSSYSKLCPHFHISMQSGNNEVLKRMNRHYKKQDLIRICNDLNLFFHNPYLAVDIIVGFPKETNEEFNDTIDTIKKMNLCELHVFRYSEREKTLAANMEGKITGEVKKKRSEELTKLSSILKSNYMALYVKKTVKVLFESYDKNILKGYTDNYIKVEVKGDKKLCGTIQDVDVTSLKKDILQGNLK